MILLGSFALSIPPAATMLLVLGAVYGIMVAAKNSPWLGPKLTGWWSVVLNFILTVLGLIIVVPAANLYSWNTLVSVIVSVLGSSGIHGMTTNIPKGK